MEKFDTIAFLFIEIFLFHWTIIELTSKSKRCDEVTAFSKSPHVREQK